MAFESLTDKTSEMYLKNLRKKGPSDRSRCKSSAERSKNGTS